jgi:RNA polymerase sigma factor (sigma-70 family)
MFQAILFALLPVAMTLRRGRRCPRANRRYVNGAALMRDVCSLERRILCMRYVEDRSQSDIAAEVGLSQRSVSRVLRRMLKQLDLAAA